MLVEKNDPKDPFYKQIALGFENGIFSVLSQERWQYVRRQVAHAFSGSSIRGTMPFLEKGVARLLEKLKHCAETQEIVDLDAVFVRLTFDFIGESAFGISFNSLDDENGEISRFLKLTRSVLSDVGPFTITPLMKYINRTGYKAMLKNVADMRSIARNLMAEARSQKDSSRTTAIWDAINQISDMGDEERLDNFVTFLIAGHDTTAHAMAFVMHALLDNKNVMTKAIEEVDSVLGASIQADYTHYGQLNYLGMCAKETGRLYPTGNGTGRVLSETKTINGITLQKGMTVQTSQHMLHFREDFFPEPAKFDPERWTKENESMRPKCSFIQFSQGPRDCVGKTMSVMEQIVVVATLLRNFRFELKPGYEFGTRADIVNSPLNGLPVRVHVRNNDA
jgi:cytochrome P450